MKYLIKLFKIIFNVIITIITLLIIVIAYNLIRVDILKNEYANFFGYTYFEIVSGSMSDTLEINDIILVKITKDVHENDIITFVQDDAIVTHRLIKETEDKLITKGDANNDEDSPIQKDCVIGKVEKVIPKLGIWFKVLSEFKVISCILITILFFGMAIYTNDENKNKKKRHSFKKFFKNIKGTIINGKKNQKK